ncbi:hypothetical protein [Citricoccus nitrophenolicus]|uniref:hypothetical protein n=1 Tax=Citricoccus nitrophenolicus TaxID=863575 RepID=UPI0031E98945
MYAPIDLQTPLVAQGMGILLAIIGAAVLAHGLWRRKRYRTHADDQDARYAGPDRARDATREIMAGIGVLILGVAALVFAAFESQASDRAIQDNVTAKYGVESVLGKEWRGNALNADVTMPDGTVHQDVLITFEESGEPQISRDLTEAPE